MDGFDIVHPNLVAVLHVGRNDAAGYFYYVMELADPMLIGGQKGAAEVVAAFARPASGFDPATYSPRTLRSEIRTRGQLTVAECLELGLALMDALTHLHRHDLVHRDVKPSNIIFPEPLTNLGELGEQARLLELSAIIHQACRADRMERYP
jgi:eukaryotic-like serine/threonine-protein kinase